MNICIHRDEDDTDFVITDRLGSGLLAVVYAAKSEKGEQIAVKMPALNLSAEHVSRFKEEHDLLKGLSGQAVPQTWMGTEIENRRRVLLLQMAPEKKLNDHLHDLSGLDKEIVAMQAAEQYIGLLQALHQLRRSDGGIGYTCADRKLGDLRWENERLMVLDWNAVRPKQDEGIHEDIFTFASLWYQMLTARYARETLSLLDESSWADGQISIGTRRILLKALSSDSQTRYSDTNDLLVDVQEWAKSLDSDGQQLYQQGHSLFLKAEQVSKEVQEFLKKYGQSSHTGQQEPPMLLLDQEINALYYLDLARRKENAEALSEFPQALQAVKRQSSRLIDLVAHAFSVSQFRRAEKLLEWANNNLSSAKRLSLPKAESLFAIQRWELMLHLSNIAIDQTTISLREYRDDFIELLKSLTDTDNDNSTPVNNWGSAEDIATQLINKLENAGTNNSIIRLVNLYKIEAESRRLVAESEIGIAKGNYKDAHAHIQSAIELLNFSFADTVAQKYMDYLQNYLNLDDRQRNLKKRTEIADIISRLENDLREVGNILFQYLPILKQLPIPLSRQREIVQVFSAYQRQRQEDVERFLNNYPTDGKEFNLQTNPVSAILLWQLDHNLSTQQWLDFADVMSELLKKFPNDLQVKRAITEALQQAIRHVQELTNSQKDDPFVLKIVEAFQKIRDNLVGNPSVNEGV